MKKAKLKTIYLVVIIVVLVASIYVFLQKDTKSEHQNNSNLLNTSQNYAYIQKDTKSEHQNNSNLLKTSQNLSLVEPILNKTNSNCPTKVKYLYKNYTSYALNIKSELEKEINLELIGKAYGGNEGIENKRECGKVYFIMFHAGEWGSYRYWGIETDAETGKLLKWKEVSLGDKEIDYSKIWWID